MKISMVDKIVQEYLLSQKEEVVIVCVGSDKYIYDALGPLVGTEIKKESKVSLYGTLESPVHALNLCNIMDNIYTTHENAFVIGIDASLTHEVENIGHVKFRDFGVSPGKGVGKELPVVGDVSIIGITKKVSDFPIMYDTSLFFVMKLVKVISDIVLSALEQIEFENAVRNTNLEDKEVLKEYGSISYDEFCCEYI